jgi:hypothetical protein
LSAPSFALAAGIVYTALGFMGFVPALHVGDRLFGVLQVDAALNALHLVAGFWGLFAWSGATGAVSFARGLALLAGALAAVGVYGAVAAPPALLPLRGPLVWLHAATALLAAWFGWRSIARRERHAERRGAIGDRRHATLRIAYERRAGTADRRQGRYGGTTFAAG